MQPQGRAFWRLALFALAGLAVGGCVARRRTSAPTAVDPRVVLAAHLTHGMGDDALDVALVRDSVNASILVAARSGIDTAALGAEIGAGDLRQRLAALRAAGLINERRDRYLSTVPIVIRSEQPWYDSVIRSWATASLDPLRPAIDSLVRVLATNGWRDWSYHFIWSQIFDSQRLWTRVQRAHVTPPLAPAITWVVFPDNPSKSGTNYYPGRLDAKWFLSVTWTPHQNRQLALLATPAESLISLLRGDGISSSTAAQLQSLGLLSASHRIAIPVLRPGDPLHAAVQSLSARWADAVLQTLDAPFIARRLGIDPGVAWAMAYHDVAWTALSALGRAGIVSRFRPNDAAPVAYGTAVLVPADSAFLSVLADTVALERR